MVFVEVIFNMTVLKIVVDINVDGIWSRKLELDLRNYSRLFFIKDFSGNTLVKLEEKS